MALCGSRLRRNSLGRLEDFSFGYLMNSMGLDISEFDWLENLVHSPIPFMGVAPLENEILKVLQFRYGHWRMQPKFKKYLL